MSCSVCLEDIDSGLFQTPCYHDFHKGCLLQWFTTCQAQGNEKSCPLCRRNLSSVLEEMKENDREGYLQYARVNGVNIEFRKKNLKLGAIALEGIFGALGLDYLSGLTQNMQTMIADQPGVMGCTEDTDSKQSIKGMIGVIMGTLAMNSAKKAQESYVQRTRGVRRSQRRIQRRVFSEPTDSIPI